MIEIALFTIIVLTFLVCTKLHGLVSFPTFGVVGFAIYSIPGLIDLALPLYMATWREKVLLPTPMRSDLIVIQAWLCLAFGLFIFRRRQALVPRGNVLDPKEVQFAMHACFIVAIMGFSYLSYQSGILFFLQSRYEQISDATSVMWKWSALAGLVSAILLQRRGPLLFFIFIITIIFLRGDRTIIAFVVPAAVMAITSNPVDYRKLLKIRYVIIGSAVLVSILFGKTIYTYIKYILGESGELPQFDMGIQAVGQFEPLVTYGHLEYVMDNDINIGFYDFFISIISNFLIVPSYFDLSSNIYNTELSQTFSNELTWGLAGSYVAHGWAVGGAPGVIGFQLLLAWSLVSCDKEFRCRSGLGKIFFGCLGGVISFYVFRNGLDNILSFVRQLAIFFVIIWISYRFIKHKSY